MNRTSRRGLTLLELVVVLAILGILALVAVVSVEPAVTQAQYDATRRTLDNIETAILGPMNQMNSDGTLNITGFVADIGRLPKAVGNDPATQLSELWANPDPAFPVYGIVQATSDPNVHVAGGWRGPYLHLPPQTGTPRLLDGWGNPFLLLKADGITPVMEGDEIAIVKSAGGPTDPYIGEMNMVRKLTSASAPVTVAGAITNVDPTTPDVDPMTPGTADVVVTVFVPKVEKGQPLTVDETTYSTTTTAKDGYSYSIPGVPIGLRVIRATQTIGMDTTKSDIIYLQIPSGGIPPRNIPLDLK